MQVQFRTNLGSRDAERLKIDHKKCCEGMTLEVSEAAGAALLKLGYASDVTPPPEIKPVKAVPPAATTAEDKSPAVKGVK